MEHIENILGILSLSLNIFSVVIIMWGVSIAARDFLVSRFLPDSPLEGMRRLTHIKNVLGAYVLFSLEVLIAADIVESIARPTVEDIVKLATVVAIRTVISVFLNKEIRDSEKEEKEAAATVRSAAGRERGNSRNAPKLLRQKKETREAAPGKQQRHTRYSM